MTVSSVKTRRLFFRKNTEKSQTAMRPKVKSFWAHGKFVSARRVLCFSAQGAEIK